MRPEDFDPKTFFAFHDLNGDGVWDQDEVKVSRSEQEGYFLVHCTYKKEREVWFPTPTLLLLLPSHVSGIIQQSAFRISHTEK